MHGRNHDYQSSQDTPTLHLNVALPSMPKHINNMKIGGLSLSLTYLMVVVWGLNKHAVVAPHTARRLT